MLCFVRRRAPPATVSRRAPGAAGGVRVRSGDAAMRCVSRGARGGRGGRRGHATAARGRRRDDGRRHPRRRIRADVRRFVSNIVVRGRAGERFLTGHLFGRGNGYCTGGKRTLFVAIARGNNGRWASLGAQIYTQRHTQESIVSCPNL